MSAPLKPRTLEELRELAERLLAEQGRTAPDAPPERMVDLVQELLRQRQELEVSNLELRLQHDELTRATEELEQIKGEYEDLFDFAPVGYATLDVRTSVDRANRRLGDMLNTESPALLGRPFTAHVDPEDIAMFTLFLRRVWEGPGRRGIEVRLIDRHGRRTVVQMEGEAIPGMIGRAARCRLAVVDITPQWAAQEEVSLLNATLERRVEERTKHIEELARELETFVHAVAHDLTTPLRHIRAFTALLTRDRTRFDETQLRYAEHVEHSVGRMDRMLQSLLTFFRSNQQRLRFKDVDLDVVLAEVRKDIAVELGERDVQFRVADLPTVRGDGVALQLVFSTLIGNALKFTRGRAPTLIEVFVDSTDREIVVGVRDNGVGFDMRHKDRLFGMFQRLHREEDFEGAGVGLALVRRIVHRHRGRVWGEGTPDVGATFYVGFPRP